MLVEQIPIPKKGNDKEYSSCCTIALISHTSKVMLKIPQVHTVEMRNRFKGLDLIDGVPDDLWMEVHNIVQETEIKTIPMEKKCKEAK